MQVSFLVVVTESLQEESQEEATKDDDSNNKTLQEAKGTVLIQPNLSPLLAQVALCMGHYISCNISSPM